VQDKADFRSAVWMLVAFLGLSLSTMPLMAQVSTGVEQAASSSLTRSDRDAVIAAVEAAVRSQYVFPAKAAGIVGKLEQERSSGRYSVDDAGLLAQRITQDLASASADRHLYLMYDPARFVRETKNPESSGAENVGYDRSVALRDNSGLAEMKILPGNIRYLRIARFGWIPDLTGEAYDRAMLFLGGGDAIIIDLRGNPGGEAAAVRYLVSHFLPPGTLELTFFAGTEAPVQSRALDYLPAGRLTGKPLYVLIDGYAASAAESFAYDVQQFKLGELVGVKTVGAANNNRFVPIPPGFMLSVSYGRPVHAVSGTNWEATGVQPTVPSPPVEALATAEKLALVHLKQTSGIAAERIAEYDWALDGVEAQLHPISLSSTQLQAFTGQYGKVSVRLEDGSLTMSRIGRPTAALLPLNSDGLFAVEGADLLRVRFGSGSIQIIFKGDPSPPTFTRKE
jgi:Peptidase family S41/N-terminal domain of Peptidase_S41 in eukaryotic IRBP